jgi:transposase
MLRAHYSEEERNTFQEFRYDYLDSRIQRRFEILWLHSCGKFAPEIATLVQQHVTTVRQVIKNYQQGGITLIMQIDSNHPTSELEKHKSSLMEEFTLRPPSSGKEAAARCKALTGLERSPERMRVFMGKMGMKFRKTAAIPAKADLEKQEEFKKKRWSLK